MGCPNRLEPACFLRLSNYFHGHSEIGQSIGVTGVGHPNQGAQPTEVTHMSEKSKDRTLYVQLPSEIHLAAKMLALSEGRLLGDVVAAALREYVASRRVGQLTEVAQPTQPTQPKPPRRSARTGPGSPGYVPPAPQVVVARELPDLPPAGPDDNPFEDEDEDVG